MTDILKERSDIDEQYRWDLSTLYATDADFETDFQRLDEAIAKVASFEGKLTGAEAIYECLKADTELDLLLSDLFCYANLRRSEDTRAEDAQALYMRIYAKYVEAMTLTSFFRPEVLGLPEEELKAICEDDVLAEYRYTMEKLLRSKPHTLTADQEQLLASFGEVFAAPSEIADNLMDADLVFDDVIDKDGNVREVTTSSYIDLQMSDDRVLRENAFHSFYKGYRQHINTFAASYGGTVKGHTAEAAARHYESSRAMSMAHENVPTSVYDSLIDAVRDNMDTMYRYVKFRKKMLGLEELHYYDVYAPLVPDLDRKYTYEEAQELILKAIEPLGPEYGEVVKGAFRDRWIDVYPNKGKSSGAFSSGTYHSNPYILCNYTGNLDNVSTIIHEMGHSMHSWNSNHNQPPQYADYTIFVAEVASTVNENLLINYLLEHTDEPKARMALLNQYLENFKGTVYRQTMFAEFEKAAHAMAEVGDPLTPSALCAHYEGLVEDYFGRELILDEEVGCEWARIPHFYRPFYVYKYATSYSAAVALSEAILEEARTIGTEAALQAENSAVRKYLKFLTLGGSMDPLDELKVAGVDLSTPEPVKAALKKFARFLDEAEELAEKL
ncbi:MAG: oligoendopeptidase F [Clostridia bacterium]|nr:oligoendopeptidase F [Clostridia bacterium]